MCVHVFDVYVSEQASVHLCVCVCVCVYLHLNMFLYERARACKSDSELVVCVCVRVYVRVRAYVCGGVEIISKFFAYTFSHSMRTAYRLQ